MGCGASSAAPAVAPPVQAAPTAAEAAPNAAPPVDKAVANEASALEMSEMSAEERLGILKERYSQYRVAFTTLDLEHGVTTDDCNTVGTKELGEVMKSLGQTLSEAELADMIQNHVRHEFRSGLMITLPSGEVDAEGKGRLRKAENGRLYMDFEDFLRMMDSNGNLVPMIGAAKMLAAFLVFDKDGSGFVMVMEFLEVMKGLGEPMTVADVFDADVTDGDQSSKVCYEFLVKMCLQ